MIAYYELIAGQWLKRIAKSVYFAGVTYPANAIPAGFWTATQKPAAANPAYDPATQALVGPADLGAEVGYTVRQLTPEELSAALELVIDAICEGARQYVEHELNAAGMMHVDRLLRIDPAHVMAKATEDWVNAVYYEAEVRKVLVYAGTPPDNPADFSSFGKKPYTIAQLLASA